MEKNRKPGGISSEDVALLIACGFPIVNDSMEEPHSETRQSALSRVKPRRVHEVEVRKVCDSRPVLHILVGQTPTVLEQSEEPSKSRTLS
jgi:hypothetical protein